MGPLPGSFKVCLAALIAAAAFLAFALAKYVPFQVDGGWYAYPALALYEHRDPGENQRSAEELLAGSEGRKARYYWDSRRNLYVLPTRAWFELFGTSLRSIHAYGLFQLIFLSAVGGLVFARFGGGGVAAAACWGFLCTDAVVLANAATDARPDIALAALALLLFYAAASLAGGYGGVRTIVIGLAAAIVLPLYHLTSLAPLVIIAAFLIFELCAEPGSRKGAYTALALVGAGFLTFFLRTAALDRLFPTNVPEAFAQNPYAMIDEKLSGGLLHVLRIEAARWREYGWPSNGIELAAVLAGLGALSALARRKDGSSAFPKRLFTASLCGVGVVVLCSPSARVDHLITLMPFLLLASARALGAAGPVTRKAAFFWAAAVLLSGGLKLAHGAYVVSRYGGSVGLTGVHLEAFFANLVPRDRPVLVVGPAEIWPYIPPDRNVVIDDDRNGMFDFSNDRWRRVDFVILNREYETYHWKERFTERYQNLALEEVGYVGERDGPLFIGVYRLREKG